MPPQPAWLSQLRMDALPLAEQLQGWSQPRGEVIKSTGFECKLSEAGAVFFFPVFTQRPAQWVPGL